jgi:hypothetical protein
MMTLMLAVLGWCAASVVVAGLWAAVCTGARQGAAANVPAWRQAPARIVPAGVVPVPRSAAADHSVAV